MAANFNSILGEVTENYLTIINPKKPPTPSIIESELLEELNDAIELQNAVLTKGRKMKHIHQFPFNVIAQIVRHLYHVCRIPCAGGDSDRDNDILGVYLTDGENNGVYDTSEGTFRRIARQFNSSLTQHDFNEYMNVLYDTAKRKELCEDRDLIAVNNGIFNYRTKELMPFSPEYVFLSKSRVNYVDNPTLPVIHNDVDGTDWDVDSWMQELTDDPEITQLLWEITGAIIRPNVRWNKSAWFFSQKGENGKGTLCELMRNLCGPGSHASLPLSDFGKDFALEQLLHVTAIITDENSVGEFIAKGAEIKAVITNDVLHVTRKYKTNLSFRFRGFMVQCINELPRMKDKSDSLYRRQLFVPFNKSFTGIAREYIKDDYVNRPEVLEYVLHKVLNMNYYKLSEPRACLALLEEYKGFNDPVRQFADEMLPQVVWDFLPYTFLYDLYKAWFREYSPSGRLQGRNTFLKDLHSIMPGITDWSCCDRYTRPRHMMDKPELLIARYGLDNWKDSRYTGHDIDKLCTPSLSPAYMGLMRVSAAGALNDTGDDNDVA